MWLAYLASRTCASRAGPARHRSIERGGAAGCTILSHPVQLILMRTWRSSFPWGGRSPHQSIEYSTGQCRIDSALDPHQSSAWKLNVDQTTGRLDRLFVGRFFARLGCIGDDYWQEVRWAIDRQR